MKKIYSGILSLLTILLWTINVSAQCTSFSPYGSASVGPSNLTPVTISTCNYADEYATITVGGAGAYEFTSSVTTDYFTITDANNVVISHGPSPFSVTIPSSGTYRMHIFTTHVLHIFGKGIQREFSKYSWNETQPS